MSKTEEATTTTITATTTTLTINLNYNTLSNFGTDVCWYCQTYNVIEEKSAHKVTIVFTYANKTRKHFEFRFPKTTHNASGFNRVNKFN